MNGMEAQHEHEMKKADFERAISGTRDEPVVGIEEVALAIKESWDKTEIDSLIRELEL